MTRLLRWEIWSRGIAGAYLATLIVVATFAPWLEPVTNAVGTWAWWVHATRRMVLSSGVVLLCATLVGISLGELAASRQRVFDGPLTHLTELASAIPLPVLVVVAQPLLRVSSELAVAGIVAIVRSLEVAKLVRGRAQVFWGGELARASRGLGETDRQIVRRQLRPEVLPSILASLALCPTAVVGLEACVSFLGLDSNVSLATWGGSIGSAARQPERLVQAWPAFVSGALLAAALAVCARWLEGSRPARRIGRVAT